MMMYEIKNRDKMRTYLSPYWCSACPELFYWRSSTGWMEIMFSYNRRIGLETGVDEQGSNISQHRAEQKFLTGVVQITTWNVHINGYSFLLSLALSDGS